MRKELDYDGMAALPTGTKIVNQYRQPEEIRKRHGLSDEWWEKEFTLCFRKGIPHLKDGHGSVFKVRESTFRENDRYFVKE